MTGHPSTGYSGLDEILCNLQIGDNVVWQVDSIEDYSHFVRPYVEKALEQERNVVYMRFADHEPLVKDQDGVVVYELDANVGFETFSMAVHNIITNEGVGSFYVFDCLSELVSAWATDMMIGNFFMITCPYLFELDTIAYFGILRNYHSFKTVARIRETTQLLLDVYHFKGNFYVHPLKVWNRYSPTMFLPHLQDGDTFRPVTQSMDVTQLFSHISEKGLDGSRRTLDYWDRLFLHAQELLSESGDKEEIERAKSQLSRIMVGHEERLSRLAEKTFSLSDLISINNRLIGSGFIGGKAAGMLLAQKILLNDEKLNWQENTEPHDSFYIGSDVFYTYIVENKWWKLWVEQKSQRGYFKAAEKLKQKILKGRFPSEIRQRFQEIIEYFGQSPIIVRSSSLLEDSFGNAFAGKYDSVFLVNQGSPDERYAAFEAAVREVYASTMSEDALTYRLQRGLDQMDEQMALLVQRVSGSNRGKYFFPDLAGVGVSYNTFVWQSDMDPKAGMLRLVFGLGTRAVDRVEDDYPRTIALDNPLLRPHEDMKKIARFSQRKVDLLDISENKVATKRARVLANEGLGLDMQLDMVADRDKKAEARMKSAGMKQEKAWVLTFEKLLSQTDFAEKMQGMLKTLEAAYNYPVDVEFTANFANDGRLRVNVVQCRPLQTRGQKANVSIPKDISEEKILFRSQGFTMGGSIALHLKRLIYVVPDEYIKLGISEKHEVARTIGKLNKQLKDQEDKPTLLMGPGRWGTTTPSLGVPVHFSEINHASVLCEMAYEGGNLMPELSFGTHFFQDLVEGDIFYAALFPDREHVHINRDWFNSMPNQLNELLGEECRFANVIKACEFTDEDLQIVCDVLTQRLACFFT
ncbi:phosphoenolpyruvate synthase [Anaerohalosphaera lusitana]|uniref:Phosphoenolpyruvate synthase n=1 Tax=Anaerohalosphaera lusitana TaxID=1936003 RepID=A0A1U9NPX7_9BACT|nr:PEP/pyruvate-binding domain-containing protein [Anaerohalosphaera lusitana]AQT69566.1 phosphoenolpyruvate synthase [Anaerohalosphaera lusitana]